MPKNQQDGSDYFQNALRRMSKDSVASTTETGSRRKQVELPVKAGTRVEYANTTSAKLAHYSYVPYPGENGVVVSVKSASGNITGKDGHVFVKWASGAFGLFMACHVHRVDTSNRKAFSVPFDYMMMFDTESDMLAQFMKSASSNDLVHMSSRDLWSFEQAPDGKYQISRLFDSDGKPLKA